MNQPDDDTPDELLARVAGELRGTPGVSPALDARIMAAIRQEAAAGATMMEVDPAFAAPTGASYRPATVVPRMTAGRTGAMAWLAAPRTVRFSPLAGLAMAAAVALLMFGVHSWDVRAADRRVAAALPAAAGTGTPDGIVRNVDDAPTAPAPDVNTAGAARAVSFVFVAPNAKSVSLAGDFNGWIPDATPLHEVSKGVWSIAVPLKPGRYTYSYVVNGKTWTADPAAPRAADDFGAPSSVLVVGGR